MLSLLKIFFQLLILQLYKLFLNNFPFIDESPDQSSSIPLHSLLIHPTSPIPSSPTNDSISTCSSVFTVPTIQSLSHVPHEGEVLASQPALRQSQREIFVWLHMQCFIFWFFSRSSYSAFAFVSLFYSNIGKSEPSVFHLSNYRTIFLPSSSSTSRMCSCYEPRVWCIVC